MARDVSSLSVLMSCLEKSDRTTLAAYTVCAHSIPFSLATWRDDSQSYAKDSVWANFVRYFPALESNFTREIIDTINAMTLSYNLHYSFGLFDFAFEETSLHHRYRLRNHRPQLLDSLPRTVKFPCHDPQHALPSPELLKGHAALARIFHAAGLARHIDEAFRALRELNGLVNDGRTDISFILAASLLSVLGSCAENTRTPAEFSDSKARA